MFGDLTLKQSEELDYKSVRAIVFINETSLFNRFNFKRCAFDTKQILAQAVNNI
jgi:hypothetical protein